jgi:hypothetical protein
MNLREIRKEVVGISMEDKVTQVDEIHSHKILESLKNIEITQAKTCIHLENNTNSLAKIEDIIFDNGDDGLITSHKKLLQKVSWMWATTVWFWTAIGGLIIATLGFWLRDNM